MKKWIIFIYILYSNISCNFCEKMGSYELGNDLVLLEGDRIEDRTIVDCSMRQGKCCYGGIAIIPPINTEFKEGVYYDNEYVEYVDDVEFNEQWIIVKSKLINSGSYNYWIIDKGFNLNDIDCISIKCDSIIMEHVMGPFSHSIFSTKKSELGLNLNF